MHSHYVQAYYLVPIQPETPATASKLLSLGMRCCRSEGVNDLQVCVVLRLCVCKILIRLHGSRPLNSLFKKSVWILPRWLHTFIRKLKINLEDMRVSYVPMNYVIEQKASYP